MVITYEVMKILPHKLQYQCLVADRECKDVQWLIKKSELTGIVQGVFSNLTRLPRITSIRKTRGPCWFYDFFDSVFESACTRVLLQSSRSSRSSGSSDSSSSSGSSVGSMLTVMKVCLDTGMSSSGT